MALKNEEELLAKEENDNTTINGHAYVDLGLSVKWATCNVGASSPEDNGDYFAWGETSTKSTYSWDNSKTYRKSSYNYDIGGDASLDAARANWGGTWRLPTEAEMQELADKCIWKWTTQGGKNGYKVTGPSGRSIFLPSAGSRVDPSYMPNTGESGTYWASSPHGDRADLACILSLDPGAPLAADVDCSFRYWGYSVRPVSEYNKSEEELLEKEEKDDTTINGHAYVDLGLSVKWATCNVGASSPKDDGDYFAWGETSPKSTYTPKNSKTLKKSSYNYDIGGDASLDAARANWGGTWRLPTKAEVQELHDKCTWEWTTRGKKGCKITGPSGRSIFLPSAGHRSGSSLSENGLYDIGYWTSTPCEDDASGLSAYDFLFFDPHRRGGCIRGLGLSVRPVSE